MLSCGAPLWGRPSDISYLINVLVVGRQSACMQKLRAINVIFISIDKLTIVLVALAYKMPTTVEVTHYFLSYAVFELEVSKICSSIAVPSTGH